VESVASIASSSIDEKLHNQ